MTPPNFNAHCFASSTQASTSGNYQADFSRSKDDLASMIKNKLEVDMGSSHLYQSPCPPEFDLVSYPLVGAFPSSLNLMVMTLIRLEST